MSYELENSGYKFSVKFESVCDIPPPWENEDGHGPVSDWGRRSKRPGELILNESRGAKRFYDFAEACKVALRDGWNCCRNRAEAAEAARKDYDYLRSWCNGEWRYIGVIVTLLNPDGSESDVSDSFWGIESDGDYKDVVARELTDGIITDGFYERSEVRYVRA